MSRRAGGHLLPSNALPSERALSLAVRFGDDIAPEDIRALWQPDTVPSAFLPFLAWALHVDFWDDDLPEEIKRDMMRNSFQWHRLKGTVWAVENVLETFGFKPRVYEWWEMGTEPHTFGVEGYVGTPEGELTAPDILHRRELIRGILDVVKPLRSHLAYLAIIPEPPDIGLPGDHLCRHDHCLYSHGWWPRPVERWGVTGETSPVVSGFRYRGEIRRVVYHLAPLFGATRYDELFSASWRSLADRAYIGYTHVTDRVRIAWKRRWSDGAKWSGAWEGELYRWESVKNAARIWTLPFSLGVYSEGEPLGSQNCCYAPRYRHMESPGSYSAAVYGDLVGPSEWRPIYRFYVRTIPIISERAPTSEASGLTRVAERPLRTARTGGAVVRWRGRHHPGRTLRWSGSRSWLGRWWEGWSDVDEGVCRTKKISVVREEG